jgi:DNA-binding IclR family transcriptional regulator
MNNDTKQKKTIGSVIKAVEIINYIAQSDEELGATEISEGVGYGVSATYHLLNTLKECNYIKQDEKTKKYRLGLKLWQLGLKAFKENDIAVDLKKYLVELKEDTGETSNLTVLDKKSIVYIAQEESDKMIKMFTKIGATAPLHCTASGKIFLAYMDKSKREDILKDYDLTKFTENTIDNREDLLKELEEIKNRGYGFDIEERDEDVSCVAVPIFDSAKGVLASISISGPHTRFTEENKEKWIPIILDIAQRASDSLQNNK